MKKACLVLLILLLTGCSGESEQLDRGMQLRSRLLKAPECRFDVCITADYGDKLYSFSMCCQGNAQGDVSFTVAEPETIAGITGRISDTGGQLTFDDAALQFDPMADGQITPVMAPWIFLKTLRGGYRTSAGQEGELLRLSIDDSYADDALHLDIWLNQEDVPVQGQILYDGRRILSLTVTNWVIG